MLLLRLQCCKALGSGRCCCCACSVYSCWEWEVGVCWLMRMRTGGLKAPALVALPAWWCVRAGLQVGVCGVGGASVVALRPLLLSGGRVQANHGAHSPACRCHPLPSPRATSWCSGSGTQTSSPLVSVGGCVPGVGGGGRRCGGSHARLQIRVQVCIHACTGAVPVVLYCASMKDVQDTHAHVNAHVQVGWGPAPWCCSCSWCWMWGLSPSAGSGEVLRPAMRCFVGVLWAACWSKCCAPCMTLITHVLVSSAGMCVHVYDHRRGRAWMMALAHTQLSIILNTLCI